jgi:hypothetical protein
MLSYNLLANIGLISYYIPLLFVVYYLFNKKNNKLTNFERLLFFYIFYNGIIVIIEHLILKGRINNFNPIYNILTIIDFCTIIAIFTKILHEADKNLLKILKFIIVIYLIFSIYELLFVNDLFSINIYSNNLSKSLIIIITSITIYLSEIRINITKSQKIFTYLLYMYNILTLPIALFEQFIRHNASDYFFILWSLNILFVIFYNIFLSLSLWKLKK